MGYLIMKDKLKKHGVIHDTITGYDFTVDEPLPKPKAVRQRCLECAGSHGAVRECEVSDCDLWKFRPSSPEKPDTTRKKAIRNFCLDCQGCSPSGVRECETVDCPLFSHRVPHLGIQRPQEGLQSADIDQFQDELDSARVRSG
jgi:hypothetical protein